MDITQQKSLVAKLEQHANQDALTGLNNRRYFIEQGELEFKRARRMKYNIAILMVDIDYFKKVNDMHGHKIGDLVLQHFSTLLRRIYGVLIWLVELAARNLLLFYLMFRRKIRLRLRKSFALSQKIII